MNADDHRLNQLSERIIGCAFRVANELGCGFLKKVYENALVHELRQAGLDARQQFPVTIRYDGVVVGEYTADIVVEGLILIELKVVRDLDDVHSAQCLNYVRATRLPLCLVINFAKPRIVSERFRGPVQESI